MEKSQAVQVFVENGYQLSRETLKVVEFLAPTSGRVIYLRLDSGLPNHIRIVVDPDIESDALFNLDGISRPRISSQCGTNMTRFPKKLNKGAKQIHYGTPIDATTLGGLERLLAAYAR
jgi:hypothetical protein